MAEKKNEIVPVTERFAALAQGAGDIAEAMSVNFGDDPQADGGMRWTDLERIKVLSGGAEGFEVYDPLLETSEQTKTVQVVPVFMKHARAFYGAWRGEELGGAPDCQSPNGVTGTGCLEEDGEIETRKCATCPMAQWDSGKGSGQACKSLALLFVLRDGAPADSMLPSVVQVPTTSLRQLRRTMMMLSGRGVPYYAAELVLGTNADKNATGQKFSRIVAKILRKLDGDEKAATRSYYEALRAQFGAATLEDMATTVSEVKTPKQAKQTAEAESYGDELNDEEIPF